MTKYTQPVGILLLIISTLLPVFGWAGGSAGGGGEVLICPGKKPMVLDYAQAQFPTIGGPVRLIDPDKEDLRVFIWDRIVSDDFNDTLIYHVYNDFYRELVFSPHIHYVDHPATLKPVFDIKNWIATKLNPIDDSELPYPICPGGKLLQAARNIDGKLYADPEVISLLSKGQIDVLEEHEAWYSLLLQYGCQGSRPVRDLFRDIFNLDSSPSEIKSAMMKFHNIYDDCRKRQSK